MRSVRVRVERVAALALPPERPLATAISKAATLAAAAMIVCAGAQTITVSDEAELADAAASVGYPCVLKPDESWRRLPDTSAERVTAAFIEGRGRRPSSRACPPSTGGAGPRAGVRERAT